MKQDKLRKSGPPYKSLIIKVIYRDTKKHRENNKLKEDTNACPLSLCLGIKKIINTFLINYQFMSWVMQILSCLFLANQCSAAIITHD